MFLEQRQTHQVFSLVTSAYCLLQVHLEDLGQQTVTSQDTIWWQRCSRRSFQLVINVSICLILPLTPYIFSLFLQLVQIIVLTPTTLQYRRPGRESRLAFSSLLLLFVTI